MITEYMEPVGIWYLKALHKNAELIWNMGTGSIMLLVIG